MNFTKVGVFVRFSSFSAFFFQERFQTLFSTINTVDLTCFVPGHSCVSLLALLALVFISVSYGI